MWLRLKFYYERYTEWSIPSNTERERVRVIIFIKRIRCNPRQIRRLRQVA